MLSGLSHHGLLARMVWRRNVEMNDLYDDTVGESNQKFFSFFFPFFVICLVFGLTHFTSRPIRVSRFLLETCVL